MESPAERMLLFWRRGGGISCDTGPVCLCFPQYLACRRLLLVSSDVNLMAFREAVGFGGGELGRVLADFSPSG